MAAVRRPPTSEGLSVIRRPVLPVALLAVLALTAACSPGGASADGPTSTGSTSTATSSATPTPDPAAPTTAPATPAPAPAATEPPPAAGGGTPAPPADVAGRPVLVSATLVGGGVEVTGYVEGTLVDGQQCRFELVSGSTVTSATSTSAADASVTLCPGVTIPAPAGSASAWRARLVWVPSGATSDPVAVVTP